MREWFNQLAPREQWMVGSAAVVVGIMLYFLVVWEPLSKDAKRLNSDLGDARDLVVYMQQVRAEVAQLGGRSSAPQRSGRSLLAEVDSSGKRSGISQYVKRIQPDGQTRVRLWLEDAPFEPLTAWLYKLQSQQGITLENGSLDRDSKNGTVKARLTLTRGDA